MAIGSLLRHVEDFIEVNPSRERIATKVYAVLESFNAGEWGTDQTHQAEEIVERYCTLRGVDVRDFSSDADLTDPACDYEQLDALEDLLAHWRVAVADRTDRHSDLSVIETVEESIPSAREGLDEVFV